jgi:hypothetical protein
MKSIKLALMGGAALAVTAAAAHADDLDALKAQIEALNARVAAMEAAPAVPAGYQLLAISEGDIQETPGLGWQPHERRAYGDKATVISVLPTADAPAGATISWSGYAYAGLLYQSVDSDVKAKLDRASGVDTTVERDADPENETDIYARGQLRVKASTDTAVGEVGVDLRLRGDFDGVGKAGMYMDVAWGYWAMTPELTFGGGYAGSLGNVNYGYDGACSCYLNSYGDIGFNPGDTTQMRLTYASGPLTAAVALEDASYNGSNTVYAAASDNQLGVSGELKYAGDAVNGEISAVWRAINDDNNNPFIENSLWQVGAGIGFGLGDMASLSIGAAIGSGPFVVSQTNSQPDFDFGSASNADVVAAWTNNWWGVSGIASVNLTEEVHAELGAGYKARDFDKVEYTDVDGTDSLDGDYDIWSVAGGIYYDPVSQLTIGVEAAYWSANYGITGKDEDGDKLDVDANQASFSVDLISVWRF